MILDLKSPDACDIRISGGKGSKLAKLIAGGLPVPDGFVVTAEAFADFLSHNNLDVRNLEDSDSLPLQLTKLQASIRSSALPEALVRALDERLEEDELWAVRSSAIAEDLDDASFAGQYQTVLGVRGQSEVQQAILQCWASFFDEHAVRYRLRNGIDDSSAALVIQQLVDADVAGVCFSVDPVSGEEVLVVNANYGLGESIVSGQTTPDTFRVAVPDLTIVDKTLGEKQNMFVLAPGGSQMQEVASEKRSTFSMADDHIRSLGELVLRVVDFEQQPVDIEWAFKDGRPFLLQSRPITTDAGEWQPELNTKIDPRYPLYSNGNISEIMPGVITPLSWSYTGPMIDYSFCAQMKALGVLRKSSTDLKTVGFFYHRPYLNISFMADTAANTPGISPDMIYEEFVGKVDNPTPSFTLRDLLPDRVLLALRVVAVMNYRLMRLKANVRRSLRMVEEDRSASHSERLKDWRDSELIASLTLTRKNAWPSIVHIWASTFATTTFSTLRKLSARWLGDESGSVAASLVTGLGTLPSADPAYHIFDLADLVRNDASLRELFAGNETNDDVARQLIQHTDFHQRFSRFLDDYGHRAVCEAEFINPTWREEPGQVVGHIRNFLRQDAKSPTELNARQEETRQQAEHAVASSLSLPKRLLFRLILGQVRKFIEQRETMKDVIVQRSDRARRIYRETDRRLRERGLLAAGDDIYYLEFEEVRELLNGKIGAKDAATIVARRRSDFQHSANVEVPKIQKDRPHTRAIEAAADATELTGLGVCPGVIKARARVILDPRKDAILQPGEILVAPVTDAAWGPLFVNAAALVVEVGGLLSHGSVVAREYSLPAVVAVDDATRQIKDGDTLIVDGGKGTVHIERQ